MNIRSFLVQLGIGLSLLAITILVFELTELDLWVQDNFYISGTAHWLVDKHNDFFRLVFYSGPKAVLHVLFVLALVTLTLSKKSKWVQRHEPGIVIVLLSTIATVLLVGFLKDVTDVPCPSQLTIYGGDYPISSFWIHTLSPEQAARARCFPAGHASGGFALLSLAFLFRRQVNRWCGFALGMGLGWILGVYKMLIGDHFLSHTLVTMCLAWIVTIAVAMAVTRLYRRYPKGFSGKASEPH
ncbi:phosphatase PAP2 family protein [Microbulbifer bruguierae]|uniref:Phosphatase PAP2 family protein n=1 Tax=Microbulbifer bruguierae TaxID=3029061 RepID=A0ABY8NE70_9GAMM|nr:phosphatase PAP2 family protein [Microbulbifer bruguierae]WGL16902.1 phosphatase PAP2 family protein [Microbulbifer bruguierae]